MARVGSPDIGPTVMTVEAQVVFPEPPQFLALRLPSSPQLPPCSKGEVWCHCPHHLHHHQHTAARGEAKEKSSTTVPTTTTTISTAASGGEAKGQSCAIIRKDMGGEMGLVWAPESSEPIHILGNRQLQVISHPSSIWKQIKTGSATPSQGCINTFVRFHS